MDQVLTDLNNTFQAASQAILLKSNADCEFLLYLFYRVTMYYTIITIVLNTIQTIMYLVQPLYAFQERYGSVKAWTYWADYFHVVLNGNGPAGFPPSAFYQTNNFPNVSPLSQLTLFGDLFKVGSYAIVLAAVLKFMQGNNAMTRFGSLNNVLRS